MTTEDPVLPFPFPPAAPGAVPVEFARLRRECPVARVLLPTGDSAWLVTGYAGVRQVLSDPRLSRAAAAAPGAPRLGPAPPSATSLMAMDPPDHTRLRHLLAPAFTRRRMEGLRGPVRATVAGLVDELVAQGPPADVATGLSRPLAMTVICELLGVPAADRDAFDDRTNRALTLRPDARAEVERARAEVHEYLGRLVAERRRQPGDDLISMLAPRVGAGELTEAELAEIGATVLTAGYHTVRNTVTNALLVLLNHTDQLERLRAEPALLPSAVEELLRYTPGPVSGGTIRVATADLDIDGTPVRAGEAVIPATTSANRDESVFHGAGQLDLGRTGNPHIAFGPGIHHCLGSHLARIELATALETLLERCPELALAVPAAELLWPSGAILGGVTALPVTWRSPARTGR